MTGNRSKENQTAVWFLILAICALIVRVIYLVQARANDPLFFAPQMDALYHHQWALSIAAGTRFIDDAFFRAPLYPYFLGLLYKVLGTNLFWVKFVQAVIGSANCGLVYLLARKILLFHGRELKTRTGENVARISGLVMAFYPLVIYFDGELLIPSLLGFLILLGLVLLFRSHDLDRQWWIPGLVFGLAAIARPNVLAFLVLVPVGFFLEYRRSAWRRMGWFLGAAVLIILPVTVRNYIVSGRPVVIAWQGGTNFYIGNNPESDGVTAILPGTRASWWGGYNDVKRFAERSAGKPLKGAEIDRYWMEQGLEFWRAHPAKALSLVARKLFLLVSGYEVSNNRDIYFFKHCSFLNLLIFNWRFLKFPFGLLFPLALVGFYLSRRIKRRLVPIYLFLGAYGLSFVLFFVTARFRMPMVPLFIIMAVYGVARVRRLEKQKLRAPIAVLVISFILVNLNLAGVGRKADQAQNHLTVAMAEHETGKPNEALAELRQALVYDSAANVLMLEATILMESGQPGNAEQAALAAVRVAPENAGVYGTAGDIYAGMGRFDLASGYFGKAVELDPYSVQAWNNLGNIALSRKDLAQARRYYERALRINPVFTIALFHLGLVDYYEGNKEIARSRWKHVLELDPNHTKARQALNQLR